MKLIFLVEEGVQAHLPISEIWHDSAFYIAPLEELLSIEGQVTSNRRERQLGALVNCFILGLLVQADADDEIRAKVAAHIKLIIHPTFAEGAVYSVPADGASLENLMRWMLERHSLASTTFARFSAQSEIALAGLRKSFHEAQAALSVAERLVKAAAIPSDALVEHIATDDFFMLAPDASNAAQLSLKQTSWQSLGSLKRLDLQFRPSGGPGAVTVEVSGAFSGRPIIRWTRSYQKLTEGWNGFSCPLRIALDQPIEVTVSWSGRIDAPPIGFGARVPDANLAAVASDGSHVGRPLAMRAWTSPYEVATPVEQVTADGPFVLDGTSDPSNLLLPTSGNLLAQTSPFDSASGKGNSVRWVADQSVLMVHPSGTRPVIGTIGNVSVKGLRRISAQVHLNHAEAVATEFAVAALPSPTDRKPVWPNSIFRGLLKPIVGAGAVEKEIASKGKWLKLSAGEHGEVTYSLAVPYTGTIDIFLMTRNPTEKNAYAWALFRGLSFDLEGS